MIMKICPLKKLPDWRDARDYEFMNSLGADQWAWAFLKRNPRYIEEWEKLTEGLTYQQKFENPWYLISRGVGGGLGSAHHWGLAGPYLNPDPNILYCDIPFIPPGGQRTVEIVSGKPQGTIFLGFPNHKTGEVLFSFNFNQPITPQLQVAKKELLKLQKESKEKGNMPRKAFKPRGRDDLIMLIRILDAQAAGVRDKEIAQELFPNEFSRCDVDAIKKVYDRKKQAERFITEDYRLLAYSDE